MVTDLRGLRTVWLSAGSSADTMARVMEECVPIRSAAKDDRRWAGLYPGRWFGRWFPSEYSGERGRYV